MGTTVMLRSRSARTLGAVTGAITATGLVSMAVDGLQVLLTYGAPLALLGVLGWAALWRPYVEVSDGGVTVANTLRTVTVPWPAVEGVEGRYGLRLRTAYGPVTAWAAGAPAGRQRARGEESEAAQAVLDRLESLRTAGHLDAPRLEQPGLLTSWHRELLAALVVLGVASVLLPLLG
jgi:hypothetical protein